MSNSEPNPSVVQPVTDTWTVRLVVFFVGLVGLMAIGGAVFLAYMGKEIPTSIDFLGGAAVTGIVALLASTKSMKT